MVDSTECLLKNYVILNPQIDHVSGGSQKTANLRFETPSSALVLVHFRLPFVLTLPYLVTVLGDSLRRDDRNQSFDPTVYEQVDIALTKETAN